MFKWLLQYFKKRKQIFPNYSNESNNSVLADHEHKKQMFNEIREKEETEFESSIDPSKFVVLDVETNGLSSVKHDLLSMAIYAPDTDTMYHRFLPLELNNKIFTTSINGITPQMLKGAIPLSQEELNDVINSINLNEKTVLTYSSLDERFLKQYFLRHNLYGIQSFHFYNFKHDIISSCYSEGNITKDNLCKLFRINNVEEIHSADNDCILEWRLFERLNGGKLLITGNKVFEFNSEEYMIPASYIATYPNFKYCVSLPQIVSHNEIIKKIRVTGGYLKKYPTNFNGMIIENLINKMLFAKKIDSRDYLLENKSKLKYLGVLDSNIKSIPLFFKEDGTVQNAHSKDKELADDLNLFISSLKEGIQPLIDYIKIELSRCATACQGCGAAFSFT